MLRFRRSAAALARVLPTFAFNCEENTKVGRWKRMSDRD
jgi:hypothetical protein